MGMPVSAAPKSRLDWGSDLAGALSFDMYPCGIVQRRFFIYLFTTKNTYGHSAAPERHSFGTVMGQENGTTNLAGRTCLPIPYPVFTFSHPDPWIPQGR